MAKETGFKIQWSEPGDIDAVILEWIVKKAAVTNPEGEYWSASVTLGSDINGTGDTIQRAYIELRNKISTSAHYRALFIKLIQKK